MSLNKLPAWAFFFLLAAICTFVPLYHIFDANLAACGRVIVEHEVSTLGDESNLRVMEFSEKFRMLRDQLRRMAMDMRDRAQQDGIRTGAALRRDELWPGRVNQQYHKFREACKRANDAAPALDPLERKIFREAFRNAYVLWISDGKATPLMDSTGDGELKASAPDLALPPCVKEWLRDSKPNEDHFSTVQIPDGNSKERFGDLAVGWKGDVAKSDGSLAVVLVVDMGRCIENLDRISPRSLYFVVDQDWKLLHQPLRFTKPHFKDYKIFDKDVAARFEGLSPETPITAKQDAMLRKNAGANISKHSESRAIVGFGVPEELQYHIVSGRIHAGMGTGERATLETVLINEMRNDPQLCCSEVNGDFDRILMSHPKASFLNETTARINENWKASSAGGIDWESPVPCKEFVAHITPMVLGGPTEDSKQKLYFITAASLQEMQSDIDGVFGRSRFNARLVMAGVLGAMAALMFGLISWPLGKVSLAAKSLQKGDYDVDLPRGYTSEVAKLSGSFGEMRDQLRGRIREIREQGDLHKTVLETASEGIIGFTMKPDFADCTIDTANPAAERMFGYREGALEGKKLVELMELDDVRRALPGEDETESVHLNGLLRRISKGPPRWGKRKDGTQFRLEVGFSAVPALRLFVLVLRDVTQRLRDEEEISKKTKLLEQGKAELEDKVRERTGELEVALVRATDAMRAKDEFISSTSHELRQPLNTIIGYTEVLIEDAEGGNEALGKDLTKIHGAAKHLLDLINDILDMAKIAAGKMELAYADFPVGDIAKDIENLSAPLAAKNGNKFVISLAEPTRAMRSDMKRVKQVMLNLLSNACKFTKDGKVEFRVEPLGADKMRFVVADTGLGMTPDQVSRLFQKFYQVDSSLARKTTGTGLGLAITRSLVELLCGEVTVRSEPGKGSVFVVDIPVNCEAEAKKRAAAATPTM